jgi:hypothetical protein
MFNPSKQEAAIMVALLLIADLILFGFPVAALLIVGAAFYKPARDNLITVLRAFDD